MNYVTEKGFFLDGQGKAYQQRGGKFGAPTEYNPDVHGLPVPLVNRKKIKNRYGIMAVKKKNVSLKMGKHKSRTGGLTAAGRKKYNAATGSNLKAPQPQGGPRKRSFCARMSGVKGPMKKPNGKPTRKALALRKWKC